MFLTFTYRQGHLLNGVGGDYGGGAMLPREDDWQPGATRLTCSFWRGINGGEEKRKRKYTEKHTEGSGAPVWIALFWILITFNILIFIIIQINIRKTLPYQWRGFKFVRTFYPAQMYGMGGWTDGRSGRRVDGQGERKVDGQTDKYRALCTSPSHSTYFTIRRQTDMGTDGRIGRKTYRKRNTPVDAYWRTKLTVACLHKFSHPSSYTFE